MTAGYGAAVEPSPHPDPPGIEVRHVGYGMFLVHETPTHRVYVRVMGYNYRVCAATYAQDGAIFSHEFCYMGKTPESWVRAVMAAWAWDPGTRPEPSGWDKDVHAGQWNKDRHPGRKTPDTRYPRRGANDERG